MLLSPTLPRPSSTTLYATHALIEIAQADGQVVSAARIVERQHLPSDFLDQLLARLRRAGLVTSVRGPRGGYVLARPAAAISLADIVSASEPSLDWLGPSACAPDFGNTECAVIEAWRFAGSAMQHVLSGTSLAALVHRKRELEHSRAVRS